MTIEFGLGLQAGPPKGQLHRFIGDLDTSLPQLDKFMSDLWMTDHFIWEDEPTHEALMTIAYLAGRYPHMNVGPIVLGQGYRNPALTAKMGATLQALSNGRFIMAIGAGWKLDEYLAYGYPFPSAGVRVEQLEDTLEIITRLWKAPGKVSYQGKHYQISDAYCEPKPDPIPTLVVGGGGNKVMRLAVRFADWWNLPDANFTYYNEHLTVLERHCEELGRDPKSLRRTWFGRIAVGKTEAQAKEFAGPRWTTYNAFVGTSSQILDQIAPFIEAGVDYFMFVVQGLPNPDVLGLLTEEVFPRLRS
ncbi:MAG: LLM class flavin-dependent oxidoreductase [Anaerolineae bacterium]|nr:LLM class flavin-dependent oxidoreductase [Anaerolineae bacterium]